VTRALRCGVLLVLVAAGLQPRGLSGGLKAAGYDRQTSLSNDLDTIFSDPILARGLIGVQVNSLRTGETIYSRNADKLVMPASNMKIVTMTVAAEKLGWNFTYETRLEAVGRVADGVLQGDLIVVGGGDPTILSTDGLPAGVFAEWAAALRAAGIRRVNGRIIGDDSYFDDETIGMGWSWDDLVFGYGAPIGGLSYNENQVRVRISPGATAGAPAKIEVFPAGHGLRVNASVTTEARPADAPAGDNRLRARVSYDRIFSQDALTIRGTIPVGAAPVSQTVAVDNPTRFFVESLRLSLAESGLVVRDGAVDLDDLPAPPAGMRTVIAKRTSPPLSVIGPYFMKSSQNYIAETIFKTLGRVVKNDGTAAAGRAVARETLAAWGVAPDAIVMQDGSGLSRYNYVTAGAIATMLTKMWQNDALRGHFAASLPVAGHDGTLDNRMKNTWLDAHVQAKTGTISNVRSLSGYLETKSGERVVFSMIANHFTAPSSQIDAVVEKALALIADRYAPR
jgi:D-alanyl-D-alanine carboxypeptidase/D-alanyl-D-alanine-endopeptidase (penicillin-binding protein 4)